MKINIKNLLAYLFTAAVSVLFMLFLDGPGGSYLIVALVLGLILAFTILMWTVKTICVEACVSEDILNKGDEISFKLTIRKKGVLPTAFIKFGITNTIHFSTDENKKYCIVIFAQDEYTVERKFGSLFFGNGKVGASELIISDYFGIFSFKISDTELYKIIKIYPDIPDINNRDNFARSLTDAVSFDDTEETNEGNNSINGFPGYEHRKYNPGDNLKLINWKLSAKRGELLVRQLEGAGESEQLFVLVRDDLYFEESQLAAEAMLGMINVFTKLELPVRVNLFIGDSREEISVNNPVDLQQLRYRMTDYYIFPLKRYCEENKLREAPELRKIAVPDKVEGDRAVIFAPAYDENLSALIDRLIACGTECQAAVCVGELSDNRVRRIVRENLTISFSD